MASETQAQRTKRILGTLRVEYPGKNAFDVDGSGQHFACEVEPASEHPEHDRAIEVIIQSKPHKHMKTTQRYTVLSGTLELHIGDKVIMLHPGDTHIVPAGEVHWSKSDDECRVEEYSQPGWTPEDHIPVN